jgi:hypothetical protein
MFRVELKSLVDLSHPLVKLGGTTNWAGFEEQLGRTFDGKTGAPGINRRLMVALHYLKYQHNLSDEAVVARWVEKPYWQQFSGRQFFEHEMPIDPLSMARRLRAKFELKDSSAKLKDGANSEEAECVTSTSCECNALPCALQPSTLDSQLPRQRLRRWMKRRAAVGPTVGHLKSDHRLERNPLRGTLGDSINALLSAAAMNFGKLLGLLLSILLSLLNLFRAEDPQPCAVIKRVFQDRLIQLH